MQKENLFFFSFPRRSNLGEAKITKSRGQYKIIFLFFVPISFFLVIFVREKQEKHYL